MSYQKLLEVNELKTHFFTGKDVVKAVDGFSFDVKPKETLGLAGESGSGKTVTALSVLRIVPPPGKVMAEKMVFEGEDLLEKSEDEMRSIRGKKIAMIFQDPSSSLNPVLSIENQLVEILKIHQGLTKKEAVERVVEILTTVGIPDAETKINDYPHQFSGGMKQRIAIARALLCDPQLIFADEPTTSLDVTIQAQILKLMDNLKQKLNKSIVLITHDMGILAETTDRIAVMYAGKPCEIAETHEIFRWPRHPYTAALMASAPRMDVRKRLEAIPGELPDVYNPPSGCPFHPRCKYTTQKCKKETPQMLGSKGHLVACHNWEKIKLASG
jgi:oligopeptide/dipeptide ABC transporter ATP-binding protein